MKPFNCVQKQGKQQDIENSLFSGLSAADADVCIPGNWCEVVQDCKL